MKDQRSRHQQLVETFMELGQQKIPLHPVLPDRYTRNLRAKLILEECIETIEALGFKITVKNGWGLTIDNDNADLTDNPEGPSLIEIVDGCCDINVVSTGTLSSCGVKDTPVQTAVDLNNIEKFGPGHTIREDGKIVKPPNHKPPNIYALLKEQESW